LLTHLYNTALRLSYFPNTWKALIIINVLKPGKPQENPSSYRPISLFPILGKIFEKLLLSRLTIFAVNKIPDFQFGFRSKHATTHQLHRVTDIIILVLETKKYYTGVFLDVAKAFDTVWPDGLLFKIKQIFPVPYYLLILSHLKDRSFKVRHNFQLSMECPVLAAIPQSSDIAPFLYILFTSDLPITRNTMIGTFVDDTALLASNTDPNIVSQHIQVHLNLLQEWFTKWKMKINETKSYFTTFSLLPGDCPPVLLNHFINPNTSQVKHLGLIFDRRLTWSAHLKDKRKKLNSRLHILRPLLHSKAPVPIKLLIYNMLLKSIWTYGIIIWGPAKPSNIRTIQVFQSICLRIILKAPWFVINMAIHNSLKIENITKAASSFYKRFNSKIQSHHNPLIIQLASESLSLTNLTSV